MKGKQNRRSSLFFIELIIAILFFVLCSTVCVLLFVQSHTISENAGELQAAVLCAQSQGARIQNGDEPDTNIWYDEQWAECGKEQAVYEMTVDKTSQQANPTYCISVDKLVTGNQANSQNIYELTVSGPMKAAE